MHIDQNWEMETSFGCRNWSDRTDSGCKRCLGRSILAKVSAEIGQARPILGGINFDVTGHCAI